MVYARGGERKIVAPLGKRVKAQGERGWDPSWVESVTGLLEFEWMWESERASARYVCERERERQLVHRECKGEQVPGVWEMEQAEFTRKRVSAQTARLTAQLGCERRCVITQFITTAKLLVTQLGSRSTFISAVMILIRCRIRVVDQSCFVAKPPLRAKYQVQGQGGVSLLESRYLSNLSLLWARSVFATYSFLFFVL